MKKYFCILLALLPLFTFSSCIPAQTKTIDSLIIIGGPYPDKYSSWGIVLKLNKRDLPGNDCLVQWNVSNGTLYYFKEKPDLNEEADLSEDVDPILIESKYNDLPYTITEDPSNGSVIWKPDDDLPEETEVSFEVNVYLNSADTLSDNAADPAVKSSIVLSKDYWTYSIKKTESPDNSEE